MRKVPKVYPVVIGPHEPYTTVVQAERPFSYVQLVNQSSPVLFIRLNNDDDAVIELGPGDSQSLNRNDVDVFSIEVANPGDTQGIVQVMVGLTDT